LEKMAEKSKNLQEISEEALLSELTVLESDLRKMGVEQSVRGIADNSQFKKMRKEIARVYTELRKRDLAEYSAEDLEMRSRIRERRARLKKA
jgi:large subunit ribosomal protein L29